MSCFLLELAPPVKKREPFSISFLVLMVCPQLLWDVWAGNPNGFTVQEPSNVKKRSPEIDMKNMLQINFETSSVLPSSDREEKNDFASDRNLLG